MNLTNSVLHIITPLTNYAVSCSSKSKYPTPPLQKHVALKYLPNSNNHRRMGRGQGGFSPHQFKQSLKFWQPLFAVSMLIRNCSQINQSISQSQSFVVTRCQTFFVAKMHQIRFRPGVYPRPRWGAYSTPQTL